jgi:putative PIG3 family NAD(P)H quinone oxidoreductase
VLTIEIREPGDPEVLVAVEREVPKPADGEVRLRVEAAGLNWADVLQRRGKYPAPAGASSVPGLEVAGTVEALGAGVTDLRVGDAVCALIGGGGYAEYCVAPAAQCLPYPRGMSSVEAASIPEAAFTVWTNVFERARLAAGESFLVHGGSSGIGTMAIQLARAFGARVFATAGSPDKCAACERLGAERAIPYKETDFVAAIREATSGRGVDVVLDMVGGPYFAKNLGCLKTGGRIVYIAAQGGGTFELPIGALMQKRAVITGSTLRPRAADEKARLAAEVERVVWPWIEAGLVKPHIERTFPLAEAGAAHALLESGHHLGKVVLTV